MTLPASYSDGTSQTIGFGEHFATCGALPASTPCGFEWQKGVNFVILLDGSQVLPVNSSLGSHRATFADITYDDVLPVLDAGSSLSRPSTPGVTFQVRPTRGACDPRIPQTGHHTLPVAMMDGSVRQVSRGISETMFWSSVTPASGEVASLD